MVGLCDFVKPGGKSQHCDEEESRPPDAATAIFAISASNRKENYINCSI